MICRRRRYGIRRRQTRRRHKTSAMNNPHSIWRLFFKCVREASLCDATFVCLQELSLSESSSSQADLSCFDTTEGPNPPVGTDFCNNLSSPVSAGYDATAMPSALQTTYEPLLTLAMVDPTKAVHHFNAMPFDALSAAIGAHLWNTGPVPDVALFYLFRKVVTATEISTESMTCPL